MSNPDSISVSRLQERLDYDPQTGHFTWKNCFHATRNGALAGSKNRRGYIRFDLDGKFVLAHRAAIAITTGKWPELPVDHINGDKADNRIANLREVTTQENLQNCLTARSRSKTGYLGVGRKHGKYRVRIYANGKRHEVYGFETPELAHEFYLLMKEVLHPGYIPPLNNT